MTAICTRSSCMDLLQVTCDACAEEDASKRPDLEKIIVRLMLLLSDDDTSDSDSDSDDSDEEDSNDSGLEPASPATKFDVSTTRTSPARDTVSEEVDSATALSSNPDEGSAQDAASSLPSEKPAEDADDLDFFALLHHHKTNNSDTDWRYKCVLRCFSCFGHDGPPPSPLNASRHAPPLPPPCAASKTSSRT